MKTINLMHSTKFSRHLLIMILMLATLSLKAQEIILKKYPKVDVNISFPGSPTFKPTDKIKFLVTITNHQKYVQKLLFGKPNTLYTWGMIANITTPSGKRVKLDDPNHHLMDSHLYSEEGEEEKKLFQFLNTGEQLSHIVYLESLIWFDFGTNDTPIGTYNLKLSYFGNVSNTITFNVTK